MTNPLPTDLVDKHCPTCFVHYAAPQALFAYKNENSEGWYCPNGHRIIFSESKLTKAEAKAEELRRERDRLKQNEAFYVERYTEDQKQKRELTRVNGALKGSLTKVRKRVGHGVCPCCNRSFSDLARHMAGKHPDFSAAA